MRQPEIEVVDSLFVYSPQTHRSVTVTGGSNRILDF